MATRRSATARPEKPGSNSSKRPVTSGKGGSVQSAELPTIGEYLIRRLQDYGIRHVFGIPGDFALPFFDALVADGRLPLYTLSHEPSVGFAADGAAEMK